MRLGRRSGPECRTWRDGSPPLPPGRECLNVAPCQCPTVKRSWFGLESETLRFLEAHQARAVAIPGRGWRDFGDAVMLYSASEKDPFFNRLVAVRWPADPAAFEARLREACDLFVALDRRPHVWAIPGLSEPGRSHRPPACRGFMDQGGGYDMVLVGEPGGSARPLPPGATLERWSHSTDEEIPSRAEALARVVGESFDIPRPATRTLCGRSA